MKTLCAEYIWLDGASSSSIRSKTRILSVPTDKLSEDGGLDISLSDIPVWAFDGSSTNQAEVDNSDCVLVPCFFTRSPLNSGGILVLCEVFDSDLKPHVTNTRSRLTELMGSVAEDEDQGPRFGFEQEYLLEKDGEPMGWDTSGFLPEDKEFYCGNGASNSSGRGVAESHMAACMMAGLSISGINAEVMMGQWEFQVGGPGVSPVVACDHLWIARFLLERVSESYGISVSWDPKPVSDQHPGSGMHTNFSTSSMRSEGGLEVIDDFCKKMSKRTAVKRHLEAYGPGLERRLTGEHETSDMNKFTWGSNDRTASVRIPCLVNKSGQGHLEDRRPNSNADPYLVCLAFMETLNS